MNEFKDLPLYSALKKYIQTNRTHFDVPGHKRNPKNLLQKEFFDFKLQELDVSSAKDLDLIGTPKGVIKDASRLMARAFSAGDAYMMLNGTTSGVQNMILSTIKPGEKIILPRNIHKSAINALILSGAVPVYIEPVIDIDFGVAHGVTTEDIKHAISNNRDAKAVLIINPTYYGATSDLIEIANLAHENHMLLLTDEAHGAHFYFNKNLPIGSMTIGADMSAVSLHKTGGSLTQSSIVLSHRRNIDFYHVMKTIDLTQTTSPSYLLLASLDVARYVLEHDGSKLLDDALYIAEYGRKKVNEIDGYYAIGQEIKGNPGVFDIDLSKLSIKVSGIGLTGIEVYDILRDKYNIQVELGDIHTIMAVVSIGDTMEMMDRLIFALKDIKIKYATNKKFTTDFLYSRPIMVVTPREAYYSNKRMVSLDEAVGEISGESVMAYPPGIPIVAPGEKITKEVVAYIEFLKKQDCILTGTDDPTIDTIQVLGS